MLSQPICKHCGGDHEIVAHDDDCPRHVFLMGDNDVQTQEEIDALPECICGDNVIGKNGTSRLRWTASM